MIPDAHPIVQALVATLFTWGVTALGATAPFFVPKTLSLAKEELLLDSFLGFGGGVMLAASFWSLLAPAIELSEDLGYGDAAFVPALVGFVLGALFVVLSEKCVPHRPIEAGDESDTEIPDEDKNTPDEESRHSEGCDSAPAVQEAIDSNNHLISNSSWKRTILLAIAVTLHNIPEGLAVGVGFGAIGTTPSATFQNAVALALGIGIQNFPEGIAVALPLRRIGYSRTKSFVYGQASGVVEPIAGVIGAAAVLVAQPILPYLLSFAAGAMVFVVFHSIVPETHSRGNHAAALKGMVMGFSVMMTLDVALG